MNIDSAYKLDQISGRFYSKIRSENGMSEHSYDRSILGESFFFGDIDNDGAFVIKRHSPVGRSAHVDPDSFCLLGKIRDTANGSHVEFSYQRTQLHIEMWLAWLLICAVILVLTFFADIIAGAILLVILATAFSIVFTDPVGKLRLKRLLKSILN